MATMKLTFFDRKNLIQRLPRDVGSSERSVLLEILDAGENCWRSWDTMAEHTGLSRATIKRAIGELKRKRLITAVDRPGLSSLLYVEWDLVATYGRPQYVEQGLFDVPLDDQLPASDCHPGHYDPGHSDPFSARPGSPRPLTRVTTTPDPGHHDPRTVTRTITEMPPQSVEGEIVKTFYQRRGRPLPPRRQWDREVEILAGLVEHAGLDVVAEAVDGLTGPRRQAIEGREYLAGCQVALRGEVARIQRQRAQRQADEARQAAEASRRANDEAMRAVEEASWSVSERAWDALPPSEQESIRHRVLAKSGLARGNEFVCRQLCIQAMDQHATNSRTERAPP
jgi:hypothetical protein